MRVSLSWLQQICNVKLAPEELAECLTRLGLEVGAVIPVPGPSERIVVARLAEVTPLPKTNLKKVIVDAGPAGCFNVISAAPNVVPGGIGVLALPGACLPDGRVIEPRKYRGETSEAMLCSMAELGLGDVSDCLLELSADAIPGSHLAELYGLPDICLEIDLTPNRGDCLSLIGIARELHAATGAELSLPPSPSVDPSSPRALKVVVHDPVACPRYLGRVIEGLDLGGCRSPLWLTERLRRAGLRASHPVVDVLNYVMLELGQPMHAFDMGALFGGGIEVRYARPGERLELLTGQVVSLQPDMLVIADQHGPVALAGILGGRVCGVRPSTESVFLESAFFSPGPIRGRARRLGLTTDAAQRYERGVDPDLAARALERASALILEIAGGRAGPVVAAVSPENLSKPREINFTTSEITRLTGLKVTAETSREILERLGFQVRQEGGEMKVTPPSARFDIDATADLVEEVARVYGYEHIPAVAPRRGLGVLRGEDDRRKRRQRFSALLRDRGFHEAVNMSFSEPERETALAGDGEMFVKLANPLSERESVLRRNLWGGLIGALAYNVARQVSRVRLFESGIVFAPDGTESHRFAGIACGRAEPESWWSQSRLVDFFDVKGLVEALLRQAGIEAPVWEASKHSALASGRCARVIHGAVTVAELGVISAQLAAAWSLPAETVLFEIDLDALPPEKPVEVHPVPRFPGVRRDLSLLLPRAISAAEMLKALRRYAGSRLADARVFDTYTGPGVPSEARSLGVSLIFQDFSRTLTDAEVDAAVSTILTGLGETMGVEIRG